MQESGDTQRSTEIHRLDPLGRHTGGKTADLIAGSVITVVEDVFGFVLLTRLVLFMPPGPFMCYCGAHVAVCGHGAAGSLVPPAWNHHTDLAHILRSDKKSHDTAVANKIKPFTPQRPSHLTPPGICTCGGLQYPARRLPPG